MFTHIGIRPMDTNEKQFLELVIAKRALLFGDFTLKSGIKSNVFFNIAALNDGEALAQLGIHYANMIMKSNIEFDMIFGPAYKGIHLASAVAIALATHHNKNIPFAFNRKETKTHGEGGNIIGADIKGRVLIIDDVITKGTACKEAITYIKNAGANPVALAVAIDRQERCDTNKTTAAETISYEFNIKIISISNMQKIKENAP